MAGIAAGGIAVRGVATGGIVIEPRMGPLGMKGDGSHGCKRQDKACGAQNQR